MRLLRCVWVMVAAVAAILLVASAASAAAGWRIAKTLPADEHVLGVSVVPGTSQAWAVGSESVEDWEEGGDLDVPLILRLDGRWREVPAPVPARFPGDRHLRSMTLRAVTARTATDAWAIGEVEYPEGQLPQTLIEHWDGTSWRVVPSPNMARYEAALLRLNNVLALAADDAWVVGGLDDRDEEDEGPQESPIALHWDGVSWSQVPPGDLGGYERRLSGIARVGQTLTAVGAARSFDLNGAAVPAPLIERFKAGAWTRMAAPALTAQLNDVTSVAWNDAWAVGLATSGQPAAILHYDGSRWTLVPGPPLPSGAPPNLNAVSAVTSHDVWAVGNGILHWDGTSWAFAHAPSGSWTDVSMRRNSGYGWAVGTSGSSSVILQHIPR